MSCSNLDCVLNIGRLRRTKVGLIANQIRKDDSPFDRIVYLIHLELIDGSYRSLQM